MRKTFLALLLAACITLFLRRRIIRPLSAAAAVALARELGAEVVVTHDDDVARALVRTALQNNATQIVVGKSGRPRWLDALEKIVRGYF